MCVTIDKTLLFIPKLRFAERRDEKKVCLLLSQAGSVIQTQKLINEKGGERKKQKERERERCIIYIAKGNTLRKKASKKDKKEQIQMRY